MSRVKSLLFFVYGGETLRLEDVFEEIVERMPNFNSPESVLRKINSVRKNLYRNYKREEIVSSMDLMPGISQYPLPCPRSSITKVIVGGKQYSYHSEGNRPYYYLLKDTIGLVPVPDRAMQRGLQIFHYETINDLSINDMDQEPVFDEHYDMIVVYGVLREMASSRELGEYQYKYNELLDEFKRSNDENIPDYIPVV